MLEIILYLIIIFCFIVIVEFLLPLKTVDLMIKDTYSVTIPNLSLKIKKIDNKIILEFDNNNIYIKSDDIHFIANGDFSITSNDSINILSRNGINLDSTEIHLNSRKCKQLNNFENIKNEILEKDLLLEKINDRRRKIV